MQLESLEVRHLLATVSGIQYDDLNQNGIFDTGDMPLNGVEVFVDLNRNDWPDTGEPFAVSAADGTYTLSNVPLGSHTVRASTPRYYKPTPVNAAVSNRLFGASSYSNSSSPTGFAVRITELDPLTGATLATHDTAVPHNNALGLAYDGERLILIDSTDDLIYELATDGEVLNSRPLSDGVSQTSGLPLPATDYGPVVIEGSVFSLRPEGIYEYEPYTDEFIYRGPLTNDWGLETLPVSPSPTVPTPTFAASVSPDGQSIIFGTTDDRTLTIDPATGITLFSPAATSNENDDIARASVGGETFVSSIGISGVQVFDGNGNLDRTFGGLPRMYGLGGGVRLDGGVTISVLTQDPISGIDHGYVSTLASISGSILDDADGDGMISASDTAAAGVTVFLDTDRNGQLDVGEASTLTDSQGDYTFDGVVPGYYAVTQLPPTGRLSRPATAAVNRLFTHVYDSSAGAATIYELDPRTGAVLREFAAPGTQTASVGLALEGSDLYLATAAVLFRMDADTGIVTEEISLQSGTITGLAIIDHVAYLQRSSTEIIDAFDLSTRRLLRSLDLGLINNGVAGSIDLGVALGESADGSQLAVGSGNEILIVDPVTGIITNTFSGIFPYSALAGAGGELYKPFSVSAGNQSRTRVYDHLGLIRRTTSFTVIGQASGFAVDHVPATSHRARVHADSELTDLDFLNIGEFGSISGVQYVDLDGNGQQDAGEPPLAGVTVFVDQNGNDWPDVGEPSAISDATGAYEILGVPYGSQIVRTQSPPNYRPTNIRYSADRLFATRGIANTSSPTGEYLQVRHLDPLSGLVQTQYDTTLPTHFASSTAYDGERIILVDNDADLLYELATDGSVIDQVPVPGGATPAFVVGPVVIENTIYLMMSQSGAYKLIRYDADANTYYGSTFISHLPEAYQPLGQPLFSITLSESPDGQSILAFSRNDDRVLVIDPLTARVTSVLVLPDTSSTDYASTSVGGELMLTSNGSNRLLDVYDQQYNLVRTLPNPLADGLAGGFYADEAISVTVSEGGGNDAVDHGHQSTLASIEGILIDDTDRDGVVDPVEPGLVGETMYLDANRNGVLDVGEATAITNAAGEYSFSGLPPGDYFVRRAEAAGQRTFAEAAAVTRLFTLEVDGTGSTIRELDPTSSTVLNHFPAPGMSTQDAGLALDGDALYYAASGGLWMLDPDSGGEVGFVPLGTGTYSGLAAVGGAVFVLDAASERILKYDPASGNLISDFDINVINQGHSVGVVDLVGGMGETADGTGLFTRTSTHALVINPETGVIEAATSLSGSRFALAGAAGELISNGGAAINVDTQSGLRIRRMSTGFVPYGLAAAEVSATQHWVRAAPRSNHAGLAFLSQPDFDFGDAPDSYHTLLTSDGPRHAVNSGLRLGGTVTSETDGVPSGDDADDNGVVINGALAIGRDHSFTVSTSAAGTLAVWIDFNRNGVFENANERSEFVIGSGGSTEIVVGVPSEASEGPTHSRFRFSTDAASVANPSGTAVDGEVEDYPIAIGAPPTDLQLSNSAINENVDTTSALPIGLLSTVDATSSDTFSYAMVSGAGDDDNARFQISAGQLLLNPGETLDAETQSQYLVRIRTTDSTGLWTEKALTIAVNNLVELTDGDVSIDDGSGQRSVIRDVQVEFDTEVTLAPGAIQVNRRGTSGGSVDVNVSTSTNPQGRTVATLTFSGPFFQAGSLLDGNYDLRIDGTKVSSVVGGFGLDADGDGVAGDIYTFGDTAADAFFRLFGDGNGDATVDLGDFAEFRSTFGTDESSPGFLHEFDATNNGRIDLSDFAEFRANFGTTNVFE